MYRALTMQQLYFALQGALWRQLVPDTIALAQQRQLCFCKNSCGATNSAVAERALIQNLCGCDPVQGWHDVV